MVQAAEGTSRKEGVTWEVGEVAARRGSGLRLERKGNLLVRSARGGVGAEGSDLFAGTKRGEQK